MVLKARRVAPLLRVVPISFVGLVMVLSLVGGWLAGLRGGQRFLVIDELCESTSDAKQDFHRA